MALDANEAKLKEVVTQYIEETDTEGNRKIKVVSKTTKWFQDGSTRHNPIESTNVEYL